MPVWAVMRVVAASPSRRKKDVSEDLCILRLKIFHHSGFTMVSKTTFDVFTRAGPDNSLKRLTERSVGFVTDRPSDIYELFVTLFE
jgi:hypothetical protein